jgi:protein-S-isoprenylcysteine O-methyltransferase Ste14
VISLAARITLLGTAQLHFGRSFHSFVVSKDKHQLITTGPYYWIRYPIYTAGLINYLSGELLASNLVLTFVPVLMFGLMIFNRIPREEELMKEKFGLDYLEYEKDTLSCHPER